MEPADWDQIAVSNGTRVTEKNLAVTSNNAEKNDQQAVPDARVTLGHGRGEIKVDQAEEELAEQLSIAQTDFHRRTHR